MYISFILTYILFIISAMSTMSDSQDAVDFSSAPFNTSEDSNSEPPFKKKLLIE